MSAPEISVVVPSHERPLRLRWLLNALDEQTLDRGRWELVVTHDSRGPETERLLREHPLASAGTLRHVTLEPGTALAGRQRNVGWREARAPIIAFTDDDCRPPPEWLELALAAARRHPGAIVQGTTRPDPQEAELLKAAPYARTNIVRPPSRGADTCNILYPREVLERYGGFNEWLVACEDADLAWRAREDGVPYVAAPEVLTYHAVEVLSLRGRMRSVWRWQHVAYVTREHPSIRSTHVLGIFWERRHVWFPFAVAGAVLERRNPLWGLLTVPWVIHAMPQHGMNPRGRLRSLTELPGRAVLDATEFAAMVAGSVRYRTLML